MTNLRIFGLFISIIFMITSCTESDVLWGTIEEDDSIDPPIEEESQLTATIDGEEFMAAANSTTGNCVFIPETACNLPFVRVKGNSENAVLTLDIKGSLLFNNFTVNDTGGNYIRISYQSSAGNFISFDATGQTQNSVLIQVSSIDYFNQTISGTFSGNLLNTSNPSETISVSNGTFTDVSFANNTANLSYDGYLLLDQGSTSYDMDVINGDFTLANYYTVGGSNIGIMGSSYAEDELKVWRIEFPSSITGVNTIDGSTIKACYSTLGPDTYDVEYAENVSGSLEITNNTSSNISGTFNFTVEDSEGNSITVSEGDFDFDL